MKKGFTLFEIIFVIVIIGILSSVLLPRFTRPTLQEAANQIVSHIQYTQHLAMVDNKFDPNYKYWYKKRWQIIFGKSNHGRGRDTGGGLAYTIFTDWKNDHRGKPDKGEIAVNPLKKGQLLSGGYSGTLDWEDEQATREMNLGKKYSIKTMNYSGCGAKRIAFDYMGRPLRGNTGSWNNPYPTNQVLSSKCVFKFCLDVPCTNDNNRYIKIVIEPETGYTYIKII